MTNTKALLIFAATAVCVILARGQATLSYTAPRSSYAPEGVGKWDATITQANIATTICTPGYTALVRSGKTPGFGAITASIKKQVYQRDGKTPDGLPAGKSHCCEIDHAFPLEIGGANIIENLWAESWDHPSGAHDKDLTEDKLHRLVCAKEDPMPLALAQRCLANDWYACGKTIGAIK